MSEEKEIVVISLFDGMSCGQIALDRLGIKVKEYYASEVDKYAMKATKHNFPNTIHIGDVRNVDVSKLPKADIIIGGSPCTDFSFAGKRKGMSGVDKVVEKIKEVVDPRDTVKTEPELETIEILTLEHYLELKEQGFEFEGQSYLFWEYMRILTAAREKNPDIYFFLENVLMGEKWQRVLTQAIGIHPICINAALVSAQNRERLFWTNIGAEPDGLFGDLACKIPQPKDKGILLKDILQKDVPQKYYLNDKAFSGLDADKIDHDKLTDIPDKSYCIDSRYNKGLAKDYLQFRKRQLIVAMRGRKNEDGKYIQKLEFRDDEKTNTLTSVEKDNLIFTKNYAQWDANGLGNKSQDQRAYYEDGKCGTLGSEGSHSQPKVLIEKDPTNPVQLGNVYDEESNPQAGRVYDPDGKAVTLKSEGGGGGAKTGLYLVGNIDSGYESNGRVYSSDGKSKTLNAGNGGGGEAGQRTGIYLHENSIRRLTPVECCRLQTVPDNYFYDEEGKDIISDTQKYRCLGNGWCVDVIVHIFSYLPFKKYDK